MKKSKVVMRPEQIDGQVKVEKKPTISKFWKEKTKKLHPSNSIRLTLTMYFMVPIIFILILGIAAYVTASKSLVQTFTQANITSFNSISDYYRVILSNVEDKASQLNNNEDASKLYSGWFSSNVIEELEIYNKLSKTVKKTSLTDRYIGGIYIITKYGNPISSKNHFGTSQTIYQDYMDSDDGILLDQSDKSFVWSGYHNFIDQALNMDESEYALSLTTKFVNDSFKPIGFIIIDLKMDVITEAMKTLHLPNNSIVTFVSPDGREINTSENGQKIEFQETPYYQDAVESEYEQGNSYIEYQDKEYLFMYSKVGDTGAMVCALIPAVSLTEKADSIKALTFIMALIASVIALCMGIFVAMGIGKEIKMIIHKVTLAGEGDLTIKVQSSRKDEFQVLANSINFMIQHMRTLIIKAQVIANSVTISAEDVNQNSELLLISSKEISQSMGEIQEGISEQAGDTQRCLDQTNELTETIDQVYQNSNAIRKIAEATKSEVESGIETVEHLNQVTKASITVMNDTAREIEELNLESETITEIVEVINSIAEQTNLLSLNATIEAARAGDYGRGFKVVADEISTLSKRSMKASGEIKGIVDSIKKKTERAVITVKQNETISRESEKSLESVIALFHLMHGHVDDLAEKINEIVVSITDMENAKIEVLNSMGSISAIAQETSASTEEVESRTSKQAVAITHLYDVVKILQNDAAELQVSIQSFIIS